MKTVRLNGRDIPAPFADRYDPLSGDELRTLAESVYSRGVLDPVHTYDSPAHGLAVIDGINRVEIASEQGIEVPVTHLGEMADDDAARLLDEKHLGRRHLSPAKQQELRAERLARVVEKRAEGKSLRTIADEEGIGLSQVQRDLADSGVPGGTPAATVTGKDGKEYPATVTKRGTFPFGADPDAASDAASDPVTDDPLPEFDAYASEPADDDQIDAGVNPLTPDATSTATPELTYAPTDHTRPRAREPFRPDPGTETGAILVKMTELATLIGKFINTPEGERFQKDVAALQGDAGLRLPLKLILHRSAFKNGRTLRHQFVGFAGLRFLIRRASGDKVLRRGSLKQGFMDAAEADTEAGGDE